MCWPDSPARIAPDGDVNESLSTLWYHDHRAEFTAQNVHKGLAGFYLHLPSAGPADQALNLHGNVELARLAAEHSLVK